MCNTPKYAKLEERTGAIRSLQLTLVLGFVLCINFFLFIFAPQDMVEVLMKGKMWNTLKGRNLMANMMR